MTDKDLRSFEDLLAELDRDPDFRQEYERQKPYYDLVLEVIKRRNQLGLTQKELAEKADTHQSCISRIESGEHDVQLSTLVQIAEALEAKVEIKFVPVFYVEDDDYRELFTISADNSPAQGHTAPTLSRSLARV